MPTRDRFECWRAAVCASHAPLDIWTDDAGDYRATHRLLDLGPVTISEFDSPPIKSRRTPRHIRQCDPELYFLAVVLTGAAALDMGRHQGSGEAGDLLLYSMSHAHRGQLGPGTQTTMVEVMFPRAAIWQASEVDGLLATPLPARTGLGALLADLLVRLTKDPALHSPSAAPYLGRAVLDLTTAFLTHLSRPNTPPEAHPEALALAVRAFIRRRLGDPNLTPTVIAAAHHVSLRTLQRCFEPYGTTVSAVIREARLDKARHDLADPGLAATPIHAIATAWGFKRASEFSRVFRSRYGQPPSEYRSSALSGR
ncbi:AraC family transcriptional regulator [Streptomyces sp. NPDC004838]